MTDNASQTAHATELLAFRLGDQEYCVDIMSVREIRGWTRATPLPFAPGHVKGVINLRGTILPVIDLAVRLGMAPVAGDDRNVIIVVAVNGHTVGLLVDAGLTDHDLLAALTDPWPFAHHGDGRTEVPDGPEPLAERLPHARVVREGDR